MYLVYNCKWPSFRSEPSDLCLRTGHASLNLGLDEECYQYHVIYARRLYVTLNGSCIQPDEVSVFIMRANALLPSEDDCVVGSEIETLANRYTGMETVFPCRIVHRPARTLDAIWDIIVKRSDGNVPLLPEAEWYAEPYEPLSLGLRFYYCYVTTMIMALGGLAWCIMIYLGIQLVKKDRILFLLVAWPGTTKEIFAFRFEKQTSDHTPVSLWNKLLGHTPMTIDKRQDGKRAVVKGRVFL